MKSVRLIRPLLFLGIFLLSTAAFAQDVSFNFDMTADFTKYKTYHWERHPNSKDLDDLMMSQLGAAFDVELAKKGLTKKTDGTSDLAIVYQVAVKQEKELSTFSSGYSMGPGWGGGYGGYYGGGGTSTSTTSVYTITTGTLALDMYDAASKKLVWRGIVTKTVDVNAKPEKRQKNMAKSAEKLFKKYPPVVKEKK